MKTLETAASNKNLATQSIPNYLGTPFHDSVYPGGPQQIPGRIKCVYYDFGGEGVAYHKWDSKNSGSGCLNPDDGSYLNTFRMNEAVGISYTKLGRQLDDSLYNFIMPEPNQLYVGWTFEGEWINYTINVTESGLYSIKFMYTSNGANQLSLAIDNTDITGSLTLISTNVAEDLEDWRQWHHWNKIELAQVKLEAGIHLLTVKIGLGGNINLDYFDFIRI
jgi:hypothetical protein